MQDCVNLFGIEKIFDFSPMKSLLLFAMQPYSVSVVDNATDFCFCEFHEIVTEPSIMTYPVVDRRVSESAA